MDTFEVIAKYLFKIYVRIPQDDKLQEIIDGFEGKWRFPQVIGVVDGTHIPIIKPKESPSDYYNKNGYYSIIMLALVDYRGVFMDAYIGWTRNK